MSTRERARRWLVGIAVQAVADALSQRRAAAAALGDSTARLGGTFQSLERSVVAVEDRVEARRPFSGTTTVHRAWARHPGVRGVFASYHLTACPDCAVGADETLAEAALGYRIPLETLLDQLNGLL